MSSAKSIKNVIYIGNMVMLLVKMIKNSKGPKWDPCGAPEISKSGSERAAFGLITWDLCER